MAVFFVQVASIILRKFEYPIILLPFIIARIIIIIKTTRSMELKYFIIVTTIKITVLATIYSRNLCFLSCLWEWSTHTYVRKLYFLHLLLIKLLFLVKFIAVKLVSWDFLNYFLVLNYYYYYYFHYFCIYFHLPIAIWLRKLISYRFTKTRINIF